MNFTDWYSTQGGGKVARFDEANPESLFFFLPPSWCPGLLFRELPAEWSFTGPFPVTDRERKEFSISMGADSVEHSS